MCVFHTVLTADIYLLINNFSGLFVTDKVHNYTKYSPGHLSLVYKTPKGWRLSFRFSTLFLLLLTRVYHVLSSCLQAKPLQSAKILCLSLKKKLLLHCLRLYICLFYCCMSDLPEGDRTITQILPHNCYSPSPQFPSV